MNVPVSRRKNKNPRFIIHLIKGAKFAGEEDLLRVGQPMNDGVNPVRASAVLQKWSFAFALAERQAAFHVRRRRNIRTTVFERRDAFPLQGILAEIRGGGVEILFASQSADVLTGVP